MPRAQETGVNLPKLVGAPTDVDPAADTRKVKYWVTMSLPSYWTPPPVDAKSGEIYIYRPDMYQDEDGSRGASRFGSTRRNEPR